MSRQLKRIVIFPKDVSNITGVKPRTAQLVLQKIRTYYNKQKNAYITLMEFCQFMNMEEEVVREYLE
jgi:hypothetical protein